MIWMERTPEGEAGVGSHFAQDLKGYADQTGKRLVVDHYGFLGQQGGFMKPTRLPDGSVGFVYDPADPSGTVSKAAMAPDEQRTCPTCNDPLKGEHGTFCPRCNWSEDNANADSDPLSNPPDPTRDMHRGIQSRFIPSHRWGKWLEAVEDLAV